MGCTAAEYGAGPSGMCMCLRFASSNVLLAGWEDGSLEMFELRSGHSRGRMKLHQEPLLCMEVDARSRFVLSGAADRRLCMTALDAPCTTPRSSSRSSCFGETERADLPVTNEASGSGGIASLCLRPDRRIFATGGWDRRVRLWQRRNLKQLAILRHHTGTVNAVHFSACSRWLVSASADKTLALWTVYSGRGEVHETDGLEYRTRDGIFGTES